MPCNKKRSKKRKYLKDRLNYGAGGLTPSEMRRERLKAEYRAAKRAARAATRAATRHSKFKRQLRRSHVKVQGLKHEIDKTNRALDKVRRKIKRIQRDPLYKSTKKSLKRARKRARRYSERNDLFDLGMDDFDMRF